MRIIKLEKIIQIIKDEYKDWGKVECDKKEIGGAKCALTEIINKIQNL